MTPAVTPPETQRAPERPASPPSSSSSSAPTGRALANLGRRADGGAVPPARERFRRRVSRQDPVVGWASGVALSLLAFALRLYHLGSPDQFEFDETYYAKNAWAMLHFGYSRAYPDTADQQILAGKTTGIWSNGPEMTVHPEVGKWLIAVGEHFFGMDPFGWRIVAAVVGSLMVLVMCRFARRVTGSTTLGLVAGTLLMFDGMQFVLSRLALLDIFLAFFTLCAVHCLVADRDWLRARLADRVPATGATGWGPVRATLFRPWLLVGGVCFGLACGTKWTAIYPLAAFGLMVWIWSAGARRSLGVRWSLLRSVVVDGLPAFVHLVLVGVVVYTATWTGWLMNADQYEDHLSSTQYTQFSGHGHCDGETYVDDDPHRDARWPTATEPDAHGFGEVVQSLESLWYYHRDVYVFHTHFLNCATHEYASMPAGWLMVNRPVGVAADTGIKPGDRGCTAPKGSDCLTQVLLIGNPTLWWGGAIAAIAAVITWIGARDWRSGVAVVGIASTWLPWLMYDSRPIFSFYAIVTLPFLVLALTLAIGRLVGSDPTPTRRRTLGVVVSGSFVVLVLLNFAWFWPIYTDQLLTHSQWLERIWFARWI